MSKKVIVIAPHPDDETLGCGGTILRHIAQGDDVIWLITTEMRQDNGFSEEQINRRVNQINEVNSFYGFRGVFKLSFPTTRLDTIPFGDIVKAISDIFISVQPEIVYIPYYGDVHTDHKIIFDAAVSCTKWFRYPYVKRILAYETLSETDFGVNPDHNGFRPNVYINIENYLEKKIEAMKLYTTEMGKFPFPRSATAITSLANVRGTAAGFEAAEAFMLIKEII